MFLQRVVTPVGAKTRVFRLAPDSGDQLGVCGLYFLSAFLLFFSLLDGNPDHWDSWSIVYIGRVAFLFHFMRESHRNPVTLHSTSTSAERSLIEQSVLFSLEADKVGVEDVELVSFDHQQREWEYYLYHVDPCSVAFVVVFYVRIVFVLLTLQPLAISWQ